MEIKCLGTKVSVLSSPTQQRLVSVLKIKPTIHVKNSSQIELFSSTRQKPQKFCVRTNKAWKLVKLIRSEQLSRSGPINSAPSLVGEITDITQFIPSKLVHLTGKGKGHGFAGVVARYGFGRGPMTRGSTHHRAPGSAGAGTFPSRVYPRKKMPGRWRIHKRTYPNIRIARLDVRHGLMWLHGSIPGKRGSSLQVKPA